MGFRPGNPYRFELGRAGGPGRPKGARHKLGEAFLEALLADFKAHGAEALLKCRLKHVDAYVAMLGRLMPREINVEISDAISEFLASLRNGDGVGAAPPSVDRVAAEPPAVRH